MLKLQTFKTQFYRWFAVAMVSMALTVVLTLAAIYPATAASGVASRSGEHSANVKDATSSDLKDIPNLEQMDYDTFEHYFGDVPGDHKPLFNPNTKAEVKVKDKTPGSDRTITTDDLKEDAADRAK